MFRTRQRLWAATLAAALLLAMARPLSAETRGWPPLRGAWEAFTAWIAARLTPAGSHRTKSGPPLCAPGQAEGSGCIDPDGATATASPPLCAAGQAEDTGCIDPNG